MPKATTDHITTMPPPLPPGGRYPTIADLSWSVAAAMEVVVEIPDNIDDTPSVLLFEQVETMQRLISSLPARTLADAAMQLHVLWIYINELKDERTEHEDKLFHAALKRLITSTLIAVAEGAGLDIARLGWEDAVAIRNNMFGGGYKV